MRLFIAAPLSDDAKRELRKAQEAIRSQGVCGTYTGTQNLHLTLAFIGEYQDPSKVLAAMRKVPFEPFDVSLTRLGSFGDLWWCGLDCPDALYSYVNALKSALKDEDIPFDVKKFRPHVTLLRRSDRGFTVPAVGRAGTIIDRVLLMRSDRTSSGMIYTAVGSVAATAK